jgi:hypothetical protein
MIMLIQDSVLAVAYSPWHFQDGKIESPTEAYIYDLEAGHEDTKQTHQ